MTMGIGICVPIESSISVLVTGTVARPVSDTTIVSSLTSASDHIDHVNTQLPYALTAGTGAALLFLLAGILY